MRLCPTGFRSRRAAENAPYAHLDETVEQLKDPSTPLLDHRRSGRTWSGR